jgi:AraC-like DNA-binding protein
METIKTYKHVHAGSEEVSFRIARMETIWEERRGKTDEPHRHEFYTVLLVRKAQGTHYIDFNAYSFQSLQVFFVSPGQVHQVVENYQSFGHVIIFSTQFLVENNIPPSFIKDLNLFNDYGHTPPLKLDENEFNTLNSFADSMLDLYNQPIQFNEQAIGSFLQLFLIHCNNLCSLSEENSQKREAGNSILRNFRELVDEKYSTWHSTSDYAAKLNVTPDHLNRVVRTLVGKTAKEYIQSRIVTEAKRMIYFSDLSAKEIGYQLGFSEPANFSAFFKKKTGKSPLVFRNAK